MDEEVKAALNDIKSVALQLGNTNVVTPNKHNAYMASVSRVSKALEVKEEDGPENTE